MVNSYGKRGQAVIVRNFAAIDAALAGLSRACVPERTVALVGAGAEDPNGYGAEQADQRNGIDFVHRITLPLIAGAGNELPTSSVPPDGRFPAGTSKLEKRRLALEIPVWDPSICTDCGKCVIVCPHAALRMKVFSPGALGTAGEAPVSFRSKDFRSKDLTGHLMSIQVSPDDCTGCRLCVEVCPAKSKVTPEHRSINMAPVGAQRADELVNWDFFKEIRVVDRRALPHDTVKGAASLEPLFEFSGACSGCGETPYLRLLSQLFGDRLLVANATGCSSIYGGNLPTTPWAINDEGRGPAWANSLFEDNAEFGLGIRLGVESQERLARSLLAGLAPRVGQEFAAEVLAAGHQETEDEVAAQRKRVGELKRRLQDLKGQDDPGAKVAQLEAVLDGLVRKSVWIVGGDGWAYDIGFGGLDQVLSSGADVNILVLDTEVYSNTGGQASKSTPRGAVARFASGGKGTPKKDLASVARSYGNVYVAQVAIGANDIQTVKAFLEAEAHHGPSLVIAYATCIEQGIEMARSMAHQKDAVQSGYWPLYRYHPGQEASSHPFKLDSKEPSLPVAEFVGSEVRYTALAREHPEHAHRLLELLEEDTAERWHYYTQLAGMERKAPDPVDPDPGDADLAGAEAEPGEAVLRRPKGAR